MLCERCRCSRWWTGPFRIIHIFLSYFYNGGISLEDSRQHSHKLPKNHWTVATGQLDKLHAAMFRIQLCCSGTNWDWSVGIYQLKFSMSVTMKLHEESGSVGNCVFNIVFCVQLFTTQRHFEIYILKWGRQSFLCLLGKFKICHLLDQKSLVYFFSWKSEFLPNQ